MKITDIRINGIREPMGFDLPRLSLSWKVLESRSRKAAETKITVAGDPAFAEVLFEQSRRGTAPYRLTHQVKGLFVRAGCRGLCGCRFLF